MSLLRRKPRHLQAVRPRLDWPAITDALLRRCEGRCEACGWSLPADSGEWDRHHRQSRRFADDSLSNLVALHSQCHVIAPWAVHQKVTWARTVGLIVPSWSAPATSSMWLPDGRLVYLTDAGSYHVIEEKP